MAPRALRPAVLGLALLMAAGARPVAAESLPWTLTATPLTATVGVSTTFTLTATNEDVLEPVDSGREIGCIVVDVPDNFRVDAAAVVAAGIGVRADRWVAGVSGNRVEVRTTSGGDRLELLEWVQFTVTALPTDPGELAWGGPRLP